MNKVAPAVGATVAALALLLGSKAGHTPVLGGGATATAPTAGSGGTSSTPSTGSSSTGSSSSGTRTVAGDAEDTRYGPVQVQITVSGTKLTAVTAVQLPQNDPRSADISSYAAPQLAQEAVAAQSAQIDTVSGASYTSEGYAASLQSAIDKAHL